MNINFHGRFNGQFINGNLIHPVTASGSWHVFWQKDVDELQTDLATVQPVLHAARRAFRTHPAVIPFAVLLGLFTAITVAAPLTRPWLASLSPSVAIGVMVTHLCLTIAAMIWMDRARQPVQRVLLDVKEYVTCIKGVIEVKAVLEAPAQKRSRQIDLPENRYMKAITAAVGLLAVFAIMMFRDALSLSQHALLVMAAAAWIGLLRYLLTQRD